MRILSGLGESIINLCLNRDCWWFHNASANAEIIQNLQELETRIDKFGRTSI